METPKKHVDGVEKGGTEKGRFNQIGLTCALVTALLTGCDLPKEDLSLRSCEKEEAPRVEGTKVCRNLMMLF